MWVLIDFLIFVAILCTDFCLTRRIEREKEEKLLHHNMNPTELKRYFGTTKLNDVPEYEISHPYLSNGNGAFQSNELTEVSAPNIQQRRTAADEKTGNRYYKLKAFGSHLHLNLTQNKVLGPNFAVETRHKNGSRTTTIPKMDDHYLGTVVSYPGSLISLTIGGGLAGMIKLPDETIYVHPLSGHLVQKDRRSPSSFPHIVVKRNNKKSLRCDVEEGDFSTPVVERRSTNGQTNDSSIFHKYLKTVYVVDEYLAAEYLERSTLEFLLPTLANIVAGLYRDNSFGPIKLNYVLNKIIFLNNSELPYAANASTYTKLYYIGKWAEANNPVSNEDPDHFDTVTLLSSGTLGGRGILGTICTSSSTANVVNMDGLNSAATIAHEVFHNFGYNHDVTEECPDHTYIMATSTTVGHASFTWSKCSRDFVQGFLSKQASQCLDDPPLLAAALQRPTEPSILLSNLPGVIYDGDKQCEYQYARSIYRQCSGKQDQCGSLYCTRDDKICHTNSAPPLDGTRCGVRHWCIRGICVDDGSPLIDGNWGDWSNYSDCTKECDIGVAYQLRACNNPSPQNGGQDCEGSIRGNYKTCNTQTCPQNSISSRQMQCSAKGDYSEYIDANDRCSLVCRSGNVIYWLGTVRDGTRCDNTKENLDVCIEGHCKEVGCDYNLNTGRRMDRCKVCGGDGSSCALNIVNYTKVHLSIGFDKADVMLTLPVHSTNVVAMEKSLTYNNIGVQTTEGEYLIVPPTWSKTIEAAGTTITYIHEDNKYADRIYIPGPTQYEINLVYIYHYERNPGVDISYYAPAEGISSTWTDFEWTVSDWSECSRSCAGGLRTRVVICVRKEDNTEVGNEFCVKSIKPDGLESCNTQSCPPEWYTTPWQTCSLSCGKGSQRRSVLCRQKIAENEWSTVSNETFCVEPKPEVSPLERNCNEINCPSEYVAGQWSACSTTCSRGVMTRKLICQRRTALGATENLPHLWCENYGSFKPSTTEDCNTDSPCEPPPHIEVGCYELNLDIFPTVLADFTDSVDYENVLDTVWACARLAFHQSYRFFGLANGGECRVGPHMESNFFKPQTSPKCTSFIGQTAAVYVYTLDQIPSITPVGCYHDRYSRRALPVLYKNFRNQINWYAMARTVLQCAHVAYYSGYQYFGVQFYGECWSGSSAKETYDYYGESEDCWEGVGEHWANFVYKFD